MTLMSGVGQHNSANIRSTRQDAWCRSLENASRNDRRRKVAIYTDNQATIWSIAKAERTVRSLHPRGDCTANSGTPGCRLGGDRPVDTGPRRHFKKRSRRRHSYKEATRWREDGCSQQSSDAPSQLYPLRTTLRR